MAAKHYEVVGVIDASVADAVAGDTDAILVEYEDPDELLICQPKGDPDE